MRVVERKWKDDKTIEGNIKTMGKTSGENIFWRDPKDFKKRNVSAEYKSCYFREWEWGDRWSFSKNIKEEPPSWSLVNIRQVKPWEIVEANKSKDKKTTPITHEIIDSRGVSFEGTSLMVKEVAKTEKKGGLKIVERLSERLMQKSILGNRKSKYSKMNSSTYMKNWREWKRFCTNK